MEYLEQELAGIACRLEAVEMRAKKAGQRELLPSEFRELATIVRDLLDETNKLKGTVEDMAEAQNGLEDKIEELSQNVTLMAVTFGLTLAELKHDRERVRV